MDYRNIKKLAKNINDGEIRDGGELWGKRTGLVEVKRKVFQSKTNKWCRNRLVFNGKKEGNDHFCEAIVMHNCS